MKEHPILFSAPMVRALLAGTKTQTRRVVKPQPDYICQDGTPARSTDTAKVRRGQMMTIPCPYGQPGDRLWVRETFLRADRRAAGRPPWVYAADYADADRPRTRWTPSIHMPRAASRITLEVTGVRVERLQDISEADAMSEGAPPSHPSIDRISREYGYPDFPRSWYAQLWDHINGPGSWEANPFVWVIEFRKISNAS